MLSLDGMLAFRGTCDFMLWSVFVSLVGDAVSVLWTKEGGGGGVIRCGLYLGVFHVSVCVCVCGWVVWCVCVCVCVCAWGCCGRGRSGLVPEFVCYLACACLGRAAGRGSSAASCFRCLYVMHGNCACWGANLCCLQFLHAALDV